MKRIYVPELETVFDVYGVVAHSERDDSVALSFVVWNTLKKMPGFDLIQAGDCVPYEDEMPSHIKADDPVKGVDRAPMESRKYPGEFYDEGICIDCPQLLDCFPGMFGVPRGPEEKFDEKSYLRELGVVADRRNRVMALKSFLEGVTPGIRVRGFTMSDDDRSVTLDIDVKSVEEFYGPESGFGKKIQDKIRDDAEKREKGNIRGAMEDSQGDGQ